MTKVQHPDIPEEPQMETEVDDALMDRFDVLIKGTSMEQAGEQLTGLQHDVVVAVGKPAGWIADQLPLHTAASDLTAPLSPDEDLGEAGGFDQAQTAANGAGGAGGVGQVPPVTPDAFSPEQLGGKAPAKRQLETLLVTGDSLSTPLDKELARRLTGKGVKVLMEPHLGTGISKTALVDWGKLSAKQAQEDAPDAVVIFIGANEGWPMQAAGGKEIECCGADWAAMYATRVRQMMNTYRRNGATRVYWLKVMTPRDADRQRIERVVNASIEVAAQPWRSQVDVVDTISLFTPGDRYRDTIDVDGKSTLVRESDGIHLNQVGSGLMADELLRVLAERFSY
jgi:lysophospholipase L1-like esterase